MIRRHLLIAALTLLGAVLFGCEGKPPSEPVTGEEQTTGEGPVEETGQKAEEATEETQEETGQTMEKGGEKMEESGEEMQEESGR